MMLNYAGSRLLRGQSFRDLKNVPEDPVKLLFHFRILVKNYDFTFSHIPRPCQALC